MRKWRSLARNVAPTQPDPAVIANLADDLNTPGAISDLHRLARDPDQRGAFVASAQLMGLLTSELAGWDGTVDLSAITDKLSSFRNKAMETKDFSAVDDLKSALIAAGLDVRMSKAGVELVPTAGFDPTKLEALL